MVKQLLQEVKQETRPASQEGKYLRLVRGKVIYISEAEAMKEEVLAGPRKRLSEEDILVAEWNGRVEEANQLKERISFVHQLMRDDGQRPSSCEPAYNTLWDEYSNVIESLRELDSEPAVSQFRDKVVDRVGELKARINNLCEDWDPDYFDYFGRIFYCYEKTFDLMGALQSGLSNRLGDQSVGLGDFISEVEPVKPNLGQCQVGEASNEHRGSNSGTSASY